MKTIVLVAGGTGNLGGRIIKALFAQGAAVRAVVRTESDEQKIADLKAQGVEVMKVDMNSKDDLVQACTGVTCVVSALQGLRDVIVDGQTVLLEAAVAAGVPHFIPSDFSTDFIDFAEGANRNFDLRREFYRRLNDAPINATSILNGAFAEVLAYNMPLLDLKNDTVGYWGDDADWEIDFTTMDDTAAFTAAAALDPTSPRELYIASFQVSPRELAHTAGSIMKKDLKLVRMGSIEELIAYNKKERAAHPEGEQQIFPAWQSSQYLHAMFTVQNKQLDNDRYPGLHWTALEDVLAQL